MYIQSLMIHLCYYYDFTNIYVVVECQNVCTNYSDPIQQKHLRLINNVNLRLNFQVWEI